MIAAQEIEFYLYDHLGNTRVVYEPTYAGGLLELAINYAADYFPYGKVLREYVNTSTGDPEKFLTTQHERDKETGLDYRGARYYDADIGRFLSLDPMQMQRLSLTPYNYVSGNPIMRIDPDGRLDDEYDKDGNKISSLGGDKLDFHHQQGGDVKVVDKSNGAESIIKGGSEFISGYTHRWSEVGWQNITDEFLKGYGPEKSLISSGKMLNEIVASPAFKGAANKFIASGKEKDLIHGDFGIPGAISAGKNMTAQMIGTANFNFYKLGGNTLVMVTDSKSNSSLSLNPFDGDEVNKSRSNDGIILPESSKKEPRTTTYQTYILYFSHEK